jgi:signal transduction histidine kinase
VAIVASLAVNWKDTPLLTAFSLVLLGLLYCLWNLMGTQEIVHSLFCEPTKIPPQLHLQENRLKATAYFIIQMGLATLIYSVFQPKSQWGLLWLVLLPPVAYSVIFLRLPGIFLISSATLVIFALCVVLRHGWGQLPNALLAFSFAVFFTLVFTLLAVSAERARGDVERMACELSEANRRLREYAVQAEELAVTRERNRLAREIHDTLGHYLTVVNIQLEAARVMLSRDPQKACDALNKAQSLTQEGLQDIRHSVSTLRSSPLDHKNLGEALRQVATSVSTSQLSAEFQLLGVERVLSQPIKLALFRTAQEGLTNVRKHSHATYACLKLDFNVPDTVRLVLADNGIGCAQVSKSGFGMIGLTERIHLIGGTLNIHTTPGAGFILEVEVAG